MSFEIGTQESVKETLDGYGWVEEVGSVGEYLRVTTSDTVSCFGSVDEGELLGWHVVEIDWHNQRFIYAPLPKDADTDD